jgi:hypothetical protein
VLAGQGVERPAAEGGVVLGGGAVVATAVHDGEPDHGQERHVEPTPRATPVRTILEAVFMAGLRGMAGLVTAGGTSSMSTRKSGAVKLSPGWELSMHTSRRGHRRSGPTTR